MRRTRCIVQSLLSQEPRSTAVPIFRNGNLHDIGEFFSTLQPGLNLMSMRKTHILSFSLKISIVLQVTMQIWYFLNVAILALSFS